MSQPEVVLEIRDLCVEFQTAEGIVRAAYSSLNLSTFL